MLVQILLRDRMFVGKSGGPLRVMNTGIVLEIFSKFDSSLSRPNSENL